MKKILILSLLVFGALVFNASAILIGDHDYELLSSDIDPVGAPSYTVGQDLGYYLWANDTSRRSWSLRWTGDGELYSFTGNVALSANTFDISTFSFETSGTYRDNIITNYEMNEASYFAFANVGEDGIDFTIVGDISPSYVGFELNIARLTADGVDVSKATEFIFIGADKYNPTSGDFAMAAPVPEPGTLLLLGTGLAGLALYRRRSMNN